ncbi:MAG: hypothetical protein U5K75_06790 [Ahrensia sp.]|nr:hypothetical protein [Ahrensia sp.]
MSLNFMDENVGKPCWNITVWALAAFVVVVCAVLLMSGTGPEVASVAQQPIG